MSYPTPAITTEKPTPKKPITPAQRRRIRTKAFRPIALELGWIVFSQGAPLRRRAQSPERFIHKGRPKAGTELAMTANRTSSRSSQALGNRLRWVSRRLVILMVGGAARHARLLPMTEALLTVWLSVLKCWFL